MKPVIGITCGWDGEKGRLFLSGKYPEAVTAGGGIPVLLAHTAGSGILERITGFIDGIVLSGGPDVDPSFWGEDPVPGCGEITPERDLFEISLAGRALSSDIPVLGICRGIQVLNIAAGGDIYQDIYSHSGLQPVKHDQQAPRWYPTHAIDIRGGTLLASILGPGQVKVNSFHHQAVRKVAPGFVVSARSSDGIIEAVESPECLFALGVQCHPEHLWERHPGFLNLFTCLAEAAAKRRKCATVNQLTEEELK